MVPSGSQILLPVQPALVVGVSTSAWLSPDGEIDILNTSDVRYRLTADVVPFVCHTRTAMRRMSTTEFQTLDLLELFAFTYPARFALPTPLGLAEALGLPLPSSTGSMAETLLAAGRVMLADLGASQNEPRDQIIDTVLAMTNSGWAWGPAVLAALGSPESTNSVSTLNGLRVWTRLNDWQETPPEPRPDNQPIAVSDVLARLSDLLGGSAEKRQGQRDFAESCTAAFQPRNHYREPILVLAEAGTGVGKTLGYVASASLWAEQNQGTVWISTFTRNLQRQLDGELDRLHPNPVEKEARVVIRKGRENYLCLLNLADAVGRQPVSGSNDIIALGLIARWASATRDGDMIGGDFPAWLIELLGERLTIDLTDTRGECIYSACDHYRKCFVEHTVRRARAADIVVANHALVMIQAALGGNEEGVLPQRYVFDEGHHLFDAADNAFSANLSGRETADLRRWLIGPEQTRGGRRGRGVRDRAGDLIAGDTKAEEALDETLAAARALPGTGWGPRLSVGKPVGVSERFLTLIRQQVYARDANPDGPYDMETAACPPIEGLLDAASTLEAALARLEAPLNDLTKFLLARLDGEAAELDSTTRARIQGLTRNITRRAVQPLNAWRSMLGSLRNKTPDTFVDWFSVSRLGGRDTDVGYLRHWLDPTQPLAKSVYEPSHGVLVTSASLRDPSEPGDTGSWLTADIRTGIKHIKTSAVRTNHTSPFDYAGETRVLVIGDVSRNSPEQVASAYRELFFAAGGGGLGLFTAIHRLRAVYDRIAAPMEAAGMPLLAQHVDPMDTGTLIDIFRAEENTCLLGTDAVRDGVDVPGRSLRLIVFDRVPWPRPTILHRARKTAFGGRAYDEVLTRLKLKQAYGRLLRRQGDRGVFVMLDRGLPSRLLTAFPASVEVKRVGLAQALAETESFLTPLGA